MNSDNVKQQLGPCFYLFRFGAMDGEEIGNILLNKVIEGMFTKAELADIVRTKWTKQSESELFNHQPRLRPAYVWDTANKLICKRSTLTNNNNQIRYVIQQHESTWFSTNELVLLGEMFFVPVQNYNGGYGHELVSLSFDIEIIEHYADNFAKDAPAKQLYSNKNVGNKSALVLATPIAIRPNKLYEIRLHQKLGIAQYFHNYMWVPEVKLNERITIKFHQNPAETHSTRRGLASTLCFNRIESKLA